MQPRGAPTLSILVVDDETSLRDTLTRSFTREGHTVTAVADGNSAIERASAEPFDVVLLDVALGPGPNGYEVCRTLRAQRNVVPIIMLTALDSEADAVQGLEAGADDYVTKPFSAPELLARLRAALRRNARGAQQTSQLQLGSLRIDLARRESAGPAGEIHLTPLEYRVLECLTRHLGSIVMQRQLIREVWGPEREDDSRSLRVCIKNLRGKLEPDPREPRYLITETGLGYRLRADEDCEASQRT